MGSYSVRRVIRSALLLACMAVVACSRVAVAAPADPDSRLIEARTMFERADKAGLNRVASGFEHPVLQMYVDYWLLRVDLDRATPVRVRAFLDRHAGTPLAERLRVDWAKRLAAEGQWERFAEEYGRLAEPDAELRCRALERQLMLRPSVAPLSASASASAATEAPQQPTIDSLEPVWREAERIWRIDAETPAGAACEPVFTVLVQRGRVSTDELWWRLRRLVEAGRETAARNTLDLLAHLGEAGRLTAGSVGVALRTPLRLVTHAPVDFPRSRAARESMLWAFASLARVDLAEAISQWAHQAGRPQAFQPGERAYVEAQLAWRAARAHAPLALDYFRRAGDTPLTEEQREWRVRAGLRAEDWAFVLNSIQSMPATQRALPAWTYWQGRAQQALGHVDEARRLFAEIAAQPNFYGNLADDELGRGTEPPPAVAQAHADDVARVAAEPGIHRALALFALGLRPEAVREWNWALRGRDDLYLLAAAELARREGIWDRAIYAAERVGGQEGYAMRYLAPFKDEVSPQARALGLDPSWVYGLMRQESRFVNTARSSAGAQGLMQLMPATAREVAKKIGLEGFRTERLQELATNVTLGTHYLRQVLDRLDNHPVLAAAAYNAGPGRAHRWRSAAPMEAAIYAETIPFKETRDYVKKVMSNTVFYAALFEGRTQRLKQRLGVIPPSVR